MKVLPKFSSSVGQLNSVLSINSNPCSPCFRLTCTTATSSYYCLIEIHSSSVSSIIPLRWSLIIVTQNRPIKVVSLNQTQRTWKIIYESLFLSVISYYACPVVWWLFPTINSATAVRCTESNAMPPKNKQIQTAVELLIYIWHGNVTEEADLICFSFTIIYTAFEKFNISVGPTWWCHSDRGANRIFVQQ